MSADKSSRHPFQVPDTGDFRCGRCGTLLDGGTDEPVEARELRKALDQAEARIAMLRAEIQQGDALLVVCAALDGLLQATAHYPTKPAGHFAAWQALNLGREALAEADAKSEGDR